MHYFDIVLKVVQADVNYAHNALFALLHANHGDIAYALDFPRFKEAEPTNSDRTVRPSYAWKGDVLRVFVNTQEEGITLQEVCGLESLEEKGLIHVSGVYPIPGAYKAVAWRKCAVSRRLSHANKTSPDGHELSHKMKEMLSIAHTRINFQVQSHSNGREFGLNLHRELKDASGVSGFVSVSHTNSYGTSQGEGAPLVWLPSFK